MVEWKKLGDVYKFQNALAFKSELFKAEGVPIFRIAKITEYSQNEFYKRAELSLSSLQYQSQIVSILDTFEASISNYLLCV